MRSTTFAEALTDQLRHDPSRPFVTFYDDETGERVELSLTTYANWVDKTAGLVQDELGVERGGLVLVDLPPHWLGAVWLGAAWRVGLAVTVDSARADEADLVVCGPETMTEHAAAGRRVVALSLRPLGARFAEPVPDGVLDYGAEVLGQPDAFLPIEPPEADDAAWLDAAGRATQAELVSGAEAEPVVAAGGRLLTDLNPCSPAGVRALLSPLLAGGGAIWVRRPDEQKWQDRYDAERATAQLRADRSS